MKRLLLFSMIAFLISGCQSEQSEPTSITVAAAASLSDAMKELNHMYEKEHPETDITLNLASSGVLANQIKQGAPIDVFLSASESHFQAVNDKGLIEPDYQKPLLKNSLVLIKTPKANSLSFSKLDDVRRLAIGTPETVPAGAYAKEALQFMNLWDKLEEDLIFGKDVRQVLTYVETGNAEAGIVYETDYRSSNNVKLVEKIPEEAYSPIIYPAGVIKGASQEATAYYTFLQSNEAKEIFEAYGFQSDVSVDE